MTAQNSGTILITVNGEERSTPRGSTVADLLESLTGQRDPHGVAVAIGTSVCRRTDWDRPLEPGDELEILVAVQGG